MMHKSVLSVFGCVAVMMAAGDSASAGERSHHHHRHVSIFKHSSHRASRTYAVVRHHRRWRGVRIEAAELYPPVPPQPFATPAWQAPIPPPPVRRAWRDRPSLAAPLGWQGPAQPPFAPPSAWQQPRVATAPYGAQGELASLVSRHAQMNGVPESLVHRVIMRESRYNPRAVSRGNYGLMQIRLGTARAMGYTGSAAGLLDPNVNMTYAVRYLAGAYRAAGGNANRAVSYYARGYYQRAKRAGFSAYAMTSPVGATMPATRAEAF
jgi:soluble lytic murein transglycosylase-like protein